MDAIEKFAGLACCNTAEAWQDQVFRHGARLGYEQALIAIFPHRQTPLEAAFAFLHSNYPAGWRRRYDAGKLGYVDPTVTHCATKSVPLIWSPEIFSSGPQREMYEEACGHGLRSGVTLPIHGARGEFGILCFVTDSRPDRNFQRNASNNLSELALLRDFVVETSLRFREPRLAPEKPVSLTKRELECLKWGAAGKTSWETAQILHCTEATVNFHFGNIRRKFDVDSRRQAVVKAIRCGLIGTP